jgi:CBS domain-containing protein
MSDIPEIGSVMTRQPDSIGEGDSVHAAQTLMEQRGIRHLPVVQDEQVVGIVTDRDVKRVLDPLVDFPAQQPVREIMVPSPYVVTPDEPLDAVLLTMAERRIGCVVVVNGGRLKGIFTTTDAARLLGQQLRDPGPSRS